ncbi:MAG: DNA primase [Chlorobi bacterium]|nr:DNA primase [Chlorobiota bacterium]
MIDQYTIDRIIETANIVDVIQEYVSLKKRGANFLGLCPFHSEKTPSFSVSPTKEIYKCFGCGKGGNVVNFLMEQEKFTYVEALRLLAAKYHIDIVEKAPTEQELVQKNERESMMIVANFANDYFINFLHNEEEGKTIGLSYFVERGFNEEIIKKFQLGYCPSGKHTFTDYAVSKGYKLEYLVKTGLTIQKEDWKIDRFSERVMFPIHNLSGRVVGFGGRTLQADKKIAKYLNSPESEIYHKSKVLYGFYFAKKSILTNDCCYLVEGYTDVISLHQAGIENVVASSGTSLTVDQIRLIKRFTNNITVLYDGDEAGIKASLRGIDLILEQGMNVKALLFPENEDPDSYSKKLSATELTKFIELNEKDFISFKTDLLIEDAKNDPIKKAQLIQEIVQSIAIIPERIIRQVYIQECSTRLEMQEQIINAEVNKIKRKKDEALQKRAFLEQKQKELPYQAPEKYDSKGEFTVAEQEIIRLLIDFGNTVLFEAEKEDEEDITVAEYLITEINADELTIHNKVYNKILLEYEEKLDKNIAVDQKYFVNHSDPEISKAVVDLISNKYILSIIWNKHNTNIITEEKALKRLVPETILDFKGKKIKEIIKLNNEKLKEASDKKDEEAVIDLMTRYKLLKEMEQEIASRLNKRITL